jgi:hypothetical protein
MTLPVLSYRVKKLLGLGLLQISKVEKRKGSPLNTTDCGGTLFRTLPGDAEHDPGKSSRFQQ